MSGCRRGDAAHVYCKRSLIAVCACGCAECQAVRGALICRDFVRSGYCAVCDSYSRACPVCETAPLSELADTLLYQIAARPAEIIDAEAAGALYDVSAERIRAELSTLERRGYLSRVVKLTARGVSRARE